MAHVGPFASVQWQQQQNKQPELNRLGLYNPIQPPSVAPSSVTLVEQAAAATPLNMLSPGVNLNSAPLSPNSALPSPASAAVLRERDWGNRDLFSSLRSSFTSSGLAGMGGVAPVDFIAPVEHMKRLLTLPYTPGRVSFPVHRVGSSLVIDGGVAPRSPHGSTSAEGLAQYDLAGEQRELEATITRMLSASGVAGGGAPPRQVEHAAAAAPAELASAPALALPAPSPSQLSSSKLASSPPASPQLTSSPPTSPAPRNEAGKATFAEGGGATAVEGGDAESLRADDTAAAAGSSAETRSFLSLGSFFFFFPS